MPAEHLAIRRRNDSSVELVDRQRKQRQATSETNRDLETTQAESSGEGAVTLDLAGRRERAVDLVVRVLRHLD